ncbi:MAG: hypothetical protein R2710_06025 [Acidimicrobiales bacterium]
MIRPFAQKGYVDAAISDVAQEADGRDGDLLPLPARRSSMARGTRVSESISNVADQARRSDPSATAAGSDITRHRRRLGGSMNTPMRPLLHQLPGATRQITKLRQDFEDKHASGAFGYLGESTSRAESRRHGEVSSRSRSAR